LYREWQCIFIEKEKKDKGMKKDIRAYTYEQLQTEMKELGEKAFRAKQIYEWLHVKLADCFDEMTNLPKSLRSLLEEPHAGETGIYIGWDQQVLVSAI